MRMFLACLVGYSMLGLVFMFWADRKEIFDEPGIGERAFFLCIWPVFVVAVVHGMILAVRRRL